MCAGEMWTVADNVLDLSLKKSAAQHHSSSPSSVPLTSSFSATSSPHRRDVTLAQLDTCFSSCDEETPDRLTSTAAGTSSSRSDSSRCRRLWRRRHVTPPPRPVCVTATMSDQPSVLHVSTSPPPSSALSTLTAKRARQHSGQDSSSSSSSIERQESPVMRHDEQDVDVDDTYVERRRKNNEAAKRSRDARRLKERQTAIRAASLQQENVQLKAEIVVLRNQAAKLHCLLYNKLGI